MVTQLQPDVRAYLHGGEVIKRYIRVEEVAHEYGFSVEETEYIAKAASSLYKLTRIHLVKKERFDEFMKHIYKVPGTNKQIIKKFARIGEASIIYSIGRHRFIELARAAGATYKINEGTGGTVLVNLEIFDNYIRVESGEEAVSDKNKNMDELRDKVLIAEKNDGFNNYRSIYNDIIEEKIIEGRQGIEQERYLTITIERKNFEEAKAQFATLEATAARLIHTT